MSTLATNALGALPQMRQCMPHLGRSPAFDQQGTTRGSLGDTEIICADLPMRQIDSLHELLATAQSGKELALDRDALADWLAWTVQK